MKHRNWAWFLIALFPIIGFVCMSLFCTDGLQMIFDSTDETILENWFSNFNIPTFSNVLDSFLTAAHISILNNWILYYVSYLIFVICFRIAYEVLVFLPNFMISIFERRK